MHYVQQAFEETLRVASTENSKQKQLYKLGVPPDIWRIFNRSPVLQLRLVMRGIKEVQDEKFKLGHPLYRPFEIMRQQQALKQFDKIMRDEKVPGACEEACKWFFSLSPDQQLFGLDHNYVDLSSYGQVKRWIYHVADTDLKIHVSHNYFWLLLVSLCGAGWLSLETGKSMAFHFQLAGSAGAGKSWLMQALQRIAPPGLVQMLSHTSALAFTVDNDDMTDKMTCYHEAPPWAQGNMFTKGKTVGGYDSTAKHNHTMTTALSEGFLSILRFDTSDKEKGELDRNVKSVSCMNGPFVILSNQPVTDGPVADRLMLCQVSSKDRDDASKHAQDTGGVEMLRENVLHADSLHGVMVFVMLCLLTCKAMSSEVIPTVNMTAYRVFAERLRGALGRHAGSSSEPRNRCFSRLERGCISTAVMTSNFRTLLSDKAKYRWRVDKKTNERRPFDMQSLMFVARHAVVTGEMVGDIFTVMREDFLAVSAFTMAHSITAKFDPSKGSGTHARFVFGMDGVPDTNYVGIEWNKSVTVQMINNHMPADAKLGTINIMTEIERLQKFSILCHPYELVPTVAGGMNLVQDKTSAQKSMQLCVIRKCKKKVDSHNGRLFLLFHVSMMGGSTDGLIHLILRSMLQYDKTPSEGVCSRVVTSLSMKKKEQLVRNPETGEIYKKTSIMPQLFKIIRLKPDATQKITLNNTTSYQPSDLAIIGPRRKRLAATTKYVSNTDLDSLRAQAVFSIAENVDDWAVFEHSLVCGLQPANYSWENHEAVFCMLNQEYREAHRDDHPAVWETTMRTCRDEVSNRIRDLNGIARRGQSLPSLTSLNTVMKSVMNHQIANQPRPQQLLTNGVSPPDDAETSCSSSDASLSNFRTRIQEARIRRRPNPLN